MEQDSTHALVNTGVATVGASLALAQIQPIITLIAGIVAIFSGLFAIRYYYYATKSKK